MNVQNIFINQYGRLRSGWRLIIFVLAFMILYFLLVSGLRLFYVVLQAINFKLPYATFVAEVIYRISLLVAALGAGFFCARTLEGLPWRSLGLTFHIHWFRDLIVGSLVGMLSLALAVAIATALGGLEFTTNLSHEFSSIVKSIVGSAILFIFAALAEEAMFRGYLLQTLSRSKLAWLGVLITLVLFALVHLQNPNVVPGYTFANTALAGVWLALAYLRTRSLWLPLGVHWAWNWALGSLFGLPVSGMTLVAHPILKGKDFGPAWLTGGSYGIEGGAACMVALVLSSFFIWRTRLVSATPELLKLTSEENPATPTIVTTAAVE